MGLQSGCCDNATQQRQVPRGEGRALRRPVVKPSAPLTYAGEGTMKESRDAAPATILWSCPRAPTHLGGLAVLRLPGALD